MPKGFGKNQKNSQREPMKNENTKLFTEEQVRPLIPNRNMVELALCANGDGLEFRQGYCECDPESNAAPCRYCAIDSALRDALRIIDYANSIGIAYEK